MHGRASYLLSILSHQGQATDIAIQAEEIVKLKAMLNKLLSEHTGQPLSRIGQYIVIHAIKASH